MMKIIFEIKDECININNIIIIMLIKMNKSRVRGVYKFFKYCIYPHSLVLLD